METVTKRRKRLFCRNNIKAKRVVLEDMPHGILVQILLKLPSQSLFYLGCVSNAFLSIIEDRSFITQHNRLLADNRAAVEVPQLMSISLSVVGGSGFLTIQPIKCIGRSLRGSKYAHTISSQNLCFVFLNLFCFTLRKEGYCFFVNPLKRREVAMLPTNTSIRQQLTDHSNQVLFVSSCYGMGFDKTTYKLKVVCVSKYHSLVTKHKFVVHVLDLGTPSWREISSVPPGGHPDYYNKRGVCACGDMHWLMDNRERSSILSFDFTKEDFSWTPSPPTLDLTWKVHLLTFRGSLALATSSSSLQDKSHIELWVLQDYERKVWKLEYAVDVNIKYYLLEDATCGEWEHGIYFYYGRAISTTLGKTFLDLRSTPIKCFSPKLGTGYTFIMSYTRSLLSLKNYDNLVDANGLVT